MGKVMNIEDLNEENCWAELAKDLEENKKEFRPYKRDDENYRLYLECDKSIVKENTKLVDNNTGKEPGIPEKFYFCLEPTPWVGGWNTKNNPKMSIPKIVILSMNPGIDTEWINFDDSFESDEKKRIAYQKLWAKNLKGEATFADVLFNTEEEKEEKPLWGIEGRKYWIEHLLSLYIAYTRKEIPDKKKFTEELLKMNRADIERSSTYSDMIPFFDKIITIEIFPYHSFNGKGIKDLENYKQALNARQQFTKDLVTFLLKNKETKIIITRGASKWGELVPELNENEVILLSSIRNTCITENNCYIKQRGCFKILIEALS